MNDCDVQEKMNDVKDARTSTCHKTTNGGEPAVKYLAVYKCLHWGLFPYLPFILRNKWFVRLSPSIQLQLA